MKNRQMWFRVVTPVLSITVALIAFEIGLRLYGFDPLGRALEGRAYVLRPVAGGDLAYELVPGSKGFYWGAPVEINSHGFRDREHPIEKPPGTRRVAVIGDSIAFGTWLAAEETFPARLQALYANAGRPVDVLNLAVSGYDTLSEVAALERKGIRFEPDVVVVQFCINDLGDQSLDRTLIGILSRYGFLMRHSRVLQLLTQRVDRIQQLLESEFELSDSEDEFRAANAGRIVAVRHDPEVQRLAAGLLRYGITSRFASSRYPFLPWYLSEARLGKLRYSFERLSGLAQERGFRVLVLLIPILDDEGHAMAYRIAFDLVRHEARRVGFDTVDPTEGFRARGFETLMLSHDRKLDVVHPNADGHRILAQYLYSALDPRVHSPLHGRQR